MRHLLSLFALLLAACGMPTGPGGTFSGVDITGADYGKDFSLVDHNGKPRTLADFRGKVVTMFFGYTHCPDVCPTTLAEMAQAMKLLGPDAQQVQVLFVTVDPRRDTPELLAKYVPSFNPSFLGLTGDPAAIAKTAKDFRVYYQEQPGSKAGGYTVDHAAGTLVFDRQGRLRLYLNYGMEPEKIAADLRQLLRG